MIDAVYGELLCARPPPRSVPSNASHCAPSQNSYLFGWLQAMSRGESLHEMVDAIIELYAGHPAADPGVLTSTTIILSI